MYLLRERRLPEGHESAQSLFERLQDLNSYRGTSPWWRDGNIVPDAVGPANLYRSAATYEALARLTDLDIGTLVGTTLHRFVPAYHTPAGLARLRRLEGDLPRPFPLWEPGRAVVYAHDQVEGTISKACPHCWRTTRVAQLPWALRQVTTCPEHGLLLDRCAGCGRRLRLRLATGRCVACGAEVATMDAGQGVVDADDGELTMAVWGALGCGDSSLPPPMAHGDTDNPLGHMTPPGLLLYVWEAGPLLARRDPGHPLFGAALRRPPTFRKYDVRVAHALMRGAWRTLSDWPRAFHASLARIAAREGARRMNPFSFPRMLFARLPPGDPAFAWLHEAFADFVHAHLGRSPGVAAWYPVYRDVLATVGDARPSLMTRREAAASLGIGRKWLQRYINAGEIEARHATGRGAFPTWVVDSREVERLADVRGAPLTVEQAATHLGVGRDMVGALAEAGLIRVAQLRAVDGAVITIYRADFLDLSLGDLLGHLPVRPCPKGAGPGGQVLRLRGVQALLREQGGRLPELLRAVRDGALPASRATGDSLALADLWWERPDIVRYLQSLRPGEDAARYGEREVALLFGVTLRVLRRWRDAGLLRPVATPEGAGAARGGRAPERVYDRGAVDAFRARYATLIEAAALVGITTQTLQRWADRGQAPGTRVHNVPYHDGILYDQRAIEEFKATRVTAEEAGVLLGILPRTFNKWAKAGRITPVTEGIARDRLYDRAEILRLKTLPGRVCGALCGDPVTAGDAARYLGMAHRHFNRLVAQGAIRPAVGGRHMDRRYARADVDRLAEARGLAVDGETVA